MDVLTSMEVSFAVARGALQLILRVRQRILQDASWDTTKGQVAILTAGVTIATFLAAVQSQIVALSYQDNSTRLKIATNALGFAGVLFDVAAACIALLASTTLQRHIAMVEEQLNAIQDASLEQLAEISRVVTSFAPHTVSSDIYHRVLRGVADRLRALRDIATPVHSEIAQAFREIRRVEASGDAAGITMQSGIICFFALVLCLAISTQPRAVWIVSSLACSLVILLPLVVRALGRAGIRISGASGARLRSPSAVRHDPGETTPLLAPLACARPPARPRPARPAPLPSSHAHSYARFRSHAHSHSGSMNLRRTPPSTSA
ncbi:hypothetical protein B0H16DRAFT_1742737 [Mycena metata]|uniref:Transmembrane protein n=1 Tax=Mycena metata TaxID=1033252 RepID=A0AAD7MFC6_9AGAR|nr:hypothetical protein B0H16DRAFT_1742737 [Mycena metata]